MKQYNIRFAKSDDLNQVSLLFDAYRIFYGQNSDQEAGYAFLSARFDQKESVLILAEMEGNVAGFAQLYPLFSSTQMKRIWLLNDLFVDRKHRGHGLGAALIDASKQHMLNTSGCALILETEKTNLAGNQLYLKSNFLLDSTHHFYRFEC
jgi:GNAT superfamily N-acetyltransferase